MKKTILLITLLFLLSSISYSQDVTHNEKEKITMVIKTFSEGIDTQNAEKIESTFMNDFIFHGTRPDGKSLVSLSGTDLAKAHAAGRFGGRARTVRIEYLDITENMIASAKVVAYDKKVHYTYYITFFKEGDKWLMRTILQRSKMLG